MSTGAKKKKKKKGFPVGLICGIAAATIVVVTLLIYFIGKAYYSDKFLSNTFINDKDVSGKTLEQAYDLLGADDLPAKLTVTTISGKNVDIKMTDIDYKLSAKDSIDEFYKDRKKTSWFGALVGKKNYEYIATASYDKAKLDEIIKKTEWGSGKTVDAQVILNEDGTGYSVVPEVQGDTVVDMDRLIGIINTAAANGSTKVVLDQDSGVYEMPVIKASDVQEKCDKMNAIFNMSITYDFDYTTETLTGDRLMQMLDVHEDQSYDVDEDKVMEYVEYLADKYDTLNKKRKFHATLQGDITVPPSIDAKYGWWIDQQKTCDELVQLLYEGKNVDSLKPFYHEDPCGFVYTGVEGARSADDDIGDTYLEIDLTDQHCWYYKDGKLEYECYIVSGQTTTRTRTTFPGVYKLWSKAENYRMKDRNADGDEWDVKCSYWNNVSLCGIGMHDSQWRGGNVGGEIYKWNGSHGCINMTYDGAKYIYDNVEIGTPVVMYYESDDSDDWMEY